MGDMHDAWFFVGVFIFIFLVWISVGGPMRSISFTGPVLSQPSPLGSGTYLQLPKSPFTIGSNIVSLPGSSNGSSSGGGSVPTFVGGSSFGTPSIYRGIVSMNHYVSGAGSSIPENEYIEISVAQNAGVPVDITGWTISSDATGNGGSIPKGTEVPTSGIVNAAQDIILTPGERALIISGRSPIGASFKENTCIGYFGTFQKFSPSLPQNCPAPSDELASLYGTGYIRDAVCIDYVKKLPRCEIAITPPLGATSACQTFMTRYLNYNGCVDTHKNDVNFEGSTWRVYLGSTAALWRTRNELIKLIDAKGNTVDAFSY